MPWHKLVGAFLLPTSTALAAPNILNGGVHASDKIAPAINAVLSAGKVDNPIFVDYAPTGDQSNIVSLSTNGSASNKSVASGATVNHAPYVVLNTSTCCYRNLAETANYAALLADNASWTFPIAASVGGQLPAGTAPPALLVTASSSNSFNGGTSWGMEFALSPGYKGLDTTADSWVSADMAGFIASLQYNHPAWNPFDIKAALRQTAANWVSGYNHLTFGFGVVDWDSANAVASTNAMYLQPPSASIINGNYYATITLNPFRQGRRNHEVVYSVNPVYVWPRKNEYSAADIAASGGTLVYTSNGTDVQPTFTYAPAASGTVTFVAFTTDGAGAFSAWQEFSPIVITFTVGVECQQ